MTQVHYPVGAAAGEIEGMLSTRESRDSRTRSRVLRASGIAVALLVVGACTSANEEPESAQEATQEIGENAPALARFYDQDLEFGSCADYAANETEEMIYVDPFECARLEVPLDYAEPEGETAQVAVLRIAASGEDKIGSLVTNPGGPGGTGLTGVVVAFAGLKDTPLPEKFDFIGFDPRGVGASTPAIDCFTDEEHDRGEDMTTLLGVSGEWSEEDTRGLVERCAENSGGEDVLASVGTRNTAQDMDVLRAALGDDQLTFAGQSYGTRLGAVYGEMFPDKVRAMSLDGAADPTLGSAERRLTQQEGFQGAFDEMAAFCAEDAECPLGTDPEQATEAFQDIVQPLLDNPVSTDSGRELSYNRATGGVIAGLYTEQQWPRIIDGLAQVKNEGRGDELLALYEEFGGRSPDGKWINFSEANYAINCNDEERRSPEEEAELRAEVMSVSPFMQTGEPTEGVTRDACEFWPVEPSLGLPYAQDVEGLPETLVISITGDPSTPYGAAENLAESLGGTVLTVEGEQHTVAFSGANACVNEVFADYLIDLEIPAADKTCTLGE
ncbi:alpha/beta hydrolase [Actinoalloteichus hymeniacidonis]|uniref:Hydrolase or acyltransferase of alpha/beta superfamily n=1 Tax=Actinoalloteichus hymeniacidonis TaxID=340345 RepID=A0AAC9HM97_9PSEU|nr:alpha/beta hydrolase [Actinoalloteichus hymeniacidonis]AOS61909.1 putative hydrolase or acyltransferase of alpha/beta superfamily [Actinoalloteichus hymeniacidonis]MBB5910071.1 pimeloyl-ACP methyl ester carboxylesterase [Actinoalloteichus hymeniacidonis]